MLPKLHKKFIENAIDVLKDDSRFLGLAAGGSYITGDMDEYSDVDLIIVVNSSYFEEVMGSKKNIASSLGELLSAFTGEHVGEPRLLICLYGPECLHVDLKFVDIKDVAKRVEDPCILWERKACVSLALKSDKAIFPIHNLQWFEDRFWIWVHYGATKIGRGEIYESVEFVSFLRQTVIGPLILMKKGELPKGVRKIEFLAPKYSEKLKETVTSYSRESCIESLNILIELYLELREYFVTSDFIKCNAAELTSLTYLKNLKK